MEKVYQNASTDFKSLKKRGDRENKEAKSYESFIYDGVKYMLYDCVYMYNEDSEEPYVGKLTKIWELPDKTKKVEVRWFLRPKEISKWLGVTKTLENEVFFATGEGLGLANINPLEAIICPCNVVCLSKDNRNPQPSDEQLKAADFVFYRAFDVHNCAILDKFDDEVGGLEIGYVFNRKENKKSGPFLESTSGTKEKNPNIFISSETQQLSTEVVPSKLKDDAKGEPRNKDIPSLLDRNTSFRESDKSHDRPLKKIKSDDKCVEPVVTRDSKKMTDMPSVKFMVDKVAKGEMKVSIVPVEQLENMENIKRNKTPTGSDKLYDQPFKRLKSDKKQLEEKHVELEVARDSEKFNEMSSKKSMVDSKSKHEDKSPADVNNLKASGTSKPLGTSKVPDNKMGSNMNVRDLVALAKEKSKSGIYLDNRGNKNNHNNKEDKEEQSGECIKKLSMDNSLKVSALSADKGKKNAYQEFVVTPKPNAETSGWFKQPPWEDRLKKAYDQGTAILLHNVDPEYNSGEVEDIIWHVFKEKCDAKILQHTSVSSPHYAQALVLLKTKDAAHKVLTKLNEKCLMLSHGSQIFMPLVGTHCPPISMKKNSIFFGHLTIDKARFKNQREDEAVSTSHFSQSNTIEYEMAMEWCLLQLKSTKWWEKFHKQQGIELENLKNKLKKDAHKAS